MFVPLWILVPAVLLLLWPLSRTFGSRGEMIQRQRRATTPASSEQLALLTDPEIRAAIESGHKIEAIKLVRERSGLDLKGAKDLIESHGGA